MAKIKNKSITELWATPIAGNCPIGEDLRQDNNADSIYRQLKDLRRQARDAERKHMQGLESDLSHPYWQKLYDQANDILQHQSKDYELISWVIESSLRIHGFKGLCASFLQAKSCIEVFQQSMYPSLDEGEEGYWKLHSITGLNGEEVDGSLIAAIANVSMTEHNRYALWQYQQAIEGRSVLGIDSDTIVREVSETSTEFFKSLYDDLNKALAAFRSLSHYLDDIYVKDSPPCSRIIASLEQYLECLRGILSVRDVTLIPACQDDNEVICESDRIETSEDSAKTYTRNSALIELQIIADFFKKREPHSPVPFMLERTIAWAGMPLPELLAQMINNSAELSQVYALTGIKPQSIQ